MPSGLRGAASGRLVQLLAHVVDLAPPVILEHLIAHELAHASHWAAGKREPDPPKEEAAAIKTAGEWGYPRAFTSIRVLQSWNRLVSAANRCTSTPSA